MGEVRNLAENSEALEQAIEAYVNQESETEGAVLAAALGKCIRENGEVLIPIEKEGEGTYYSLAVRTHDGKLWHVLFTSEKEAEKGERCETVTSTLAETLRAVMIADAAGLVFNPRSRALFFGKDAIRGILEAAEIPDFSVL